MLAWKAIYVKDGKRRFSHWEARHEGFTFKVKPHGGFITVRHWHMDVERSGLESSIAISRLTFWSLREAKQWAEKFCSAEGAPVSSDMLRPAYL